MCTQMHLCICTPQWKPLHPHHSWCGLIFNGQVQKTQKYKGLSEAQLNLKLCHLQALACNSEQHKTFKTQFLYMCKINSKYTHTTVGIITTLNHITVILHDFWNSKRHTYTVWWVHLPHRHNPPSFVSKDTIYYTKEEVNYLPPTYLSQQDINYPCCLFLHNSSQPIMANAGIVVYAMLNLSLVEFLLSLKAPPSRCTSLSSRIWLLSWQCWSIYLLILQQE